MFDMIIIGAGTAGLTAAIYGLRAGLSVVVLEEFIYGGQIANTPDVENYPGIEKISGADFGITLYEQAKKYGALIKFEGVKNIKLTGQVKEVSTNKTTYQGKTVIIANGAKRRKLGCKGEEEFSGRGVSYCATCDGAFYKGKEVVIVGGGNTAVEDALFLANNCQKVHVVHRRDSFRASQVLVDSLKARENIIIHYDSVVEEISGTKSVERAIIKNLKDNTATELTISGVFVAVGLEPDNSIYQSEILLDKNGYIQAGENCKTNVEGVYAAGDTRTKTLRQLVTAAADGAVAAFEAGNYINQMQIQA